MSFGIYRKKVTIYTREFYYPIKDLQKANATEKEALITFLVGNIEYEDEKLKKFEEEYLDMVFDQIKKQQPKDGTLIIQSLVDPNNTVEVESEFRRGATGG